MRESRLKSAFSRDGWGLVQIFPVIVLAVLTDQKTLDAALFRGR